MPVRTSEDSNDPGTTLLLNDNPFDHSSDFIDHVSASARRRHEQRDGTSWQLPAWTRALGSFVSKINKRRISSNNQDGLCMDCERHSLRRRSCTRWGLAWFLAILMVLFVTSSPSYYVDTTDPLIAVCFSSFEYWLASFQAFCPITFKIFSIFGTKKVSQVMH